MGRVLRWFAGAHNFVPTLLHAGVSALGLPPAGGRLVVDITDTLDAKIEAIRCYETQFPPAKGHVLDRVGCFRCNRVKRPATSPASCWPAHARWAADLMHFLFGMKPGDEPLSRTWLMVPKFIYFDLGNVLLYFDQVRCPREQMAACGRAYRSAGSRSRFR